MVEVTELASEQWNEQVIANERQKEEREGRGRKGGEKEEEEEKEEEGGTTREERRERGMKEQRAQEAKEKADSTREHSSVGLKASLSLVLSLFSSLIVAALIRMLGGWAHLASSTPDEKWT